MKNILFIDPGSYTKDVYTRGVTYLISVLRKKFGELTFSFKISDDFNEDNFHLFRPDLLCISSLSFSFGKAKEIALFARSKDIPVIVGGPHISALPETLTKDMQVGVIGEGEETIVELVDILLEKEDFTPSDLYDIKGVVFWDSDELVRTQMRPPIDNLDTLPFPAYDMYIKNNFFPYFLSSRGCPYNCRFCASNYWDKKVRYFSTDYIVDEIAYVRKFFNLEIVTFWDDLFAPSLSRIDNFITTLDRKKLLDKIKFIITSRANLINDKMAQLLKRLGVVNVILGLESGNDRILKYLKGDNISLEDNIRALEVLKKHKICARGYFIVGSPIETEKEIQDTYNFIKNSSLYAADVFFLTPLPGTYFWEYAKEKGKIKELDSFDWSSLDIPSAPDFNKKIILSEKVPVTVYRKYFKKFKIIKYYLILKHIWGTIWFKIYLVDTFSILSRKIRRFFKSIRNQEP